MSGAAVVGTMVMIVMVVVTMVVVMIGIVAMLMRGAVLASVHGGPQ